MTGVQTCALPISGKKFASGDIAWQKTNDAGNAAQQEIAKIFAAGGKK